MPGECPADGTEWGRDSVRQVESGRGGSEAVVGNGSGSGFESESEVVNVAFPGAAGRFPVSVNRVAVPVPVPVLIPIPVPSQAHPVPLPRALEPAHNNLTVSRMNGEVHFKHLQSPHLEPSRALYIETGPGASWCEFKLPTCTARVAAKSQVSVFPDTGSIYLKSGAVIVRVENGSERRFSVMAGDFACRFQGSTLRVQRDARKVDFQVLEGSITVFNRATGQVEKAGQITKSLAH